MEAAGHLVQIGEAGANAREHALPLVKILDGIDGLFDQLLNRVGVALHARLTDPEDVSLDLIHQRIHFTLVIVHPADYLRASVDHLSEQIFLLHDIEIITEIGRGGHGIGQRGQVRDSADFFEQLFVLEPLLQRNDVDGLAGVVHLDQRAKNRLMAQVVEDFRAGFELLDTLPHAVVG